MKMVISNSNLDKIMKGHFRNYSKGVIDRVKRRGIWSTEYINHHNRGMGNLTFDYDICSGLWYPTLTLVLQRTCWAMPNTRHRNENLKSLTL